jgi:hypothetical protein
MPLSPAVPRKRLHQRNVRYEGFARDDGLFDIEARLVDVKDHDLMLLSGPRPKGEPVHDMWVRVTIDRDCTIHAIDAHADRMPYPAACDRVEPAYQRLVGANLRDGFRKTLHDKLGHTKGCTHLTELLVNLPTAAIQTFSSLRKHEDEGDGKPFQLDRCHALDTTTENVRRYYPKWYRAPVTENP